MLIGLATDELVAPLSVFSFLPWPNNNTVVLFALLAGLLLGADLSPSFFLQVPTPDQFSMLTLQYGAIVRSTVI